jgi:Cu(I)/Ag(I) efflux system membrane fusion protein
MNSRIKILVALLAGLCVGAAAVWFALRSGGHGSAVQAPAAAAPAGERKVLYWYDPMVPDQHFDKPGKSPFMDMELVPKYADEDAGAGVKIDPRTAQSLGVRTALAETGSLWRRIDTVGYVRPDDNRVEMLQTRVNGWIEALHVHAVNDPVRRGQPVAEIYSPDLYAAQEEFLLALRQTDDPAWREAARQKLAFLGLGEAQIAALEADRKPQRRVVYHAPAGGIVSNIAAHVGSSVSAGMPLLEITDLSRVWVTAEVVEDQAAWIAPGKSAEIGFSALPGEVFEGRVDYIYPKLDPATRTVQVRIVLANPGLRLKPGMYARVTLFGGKGESGVIVPSEAVIHTGKRAIVLIAEGEGRFTPAEVRTGMENDGRTLILEGLRGGEQVVTSGQFLIESEANLKGALEKLKPLGGEVYRGTARIVASDPKTGELTMDHDPIPALKWPAMVMDFEVADSAVLKDLKKGQAVNFEMVKKDDGFVVTAIRPASHAPTQPSPASGGGPGRGPGQDAGR